MTFPILVKARGGQFAASLAGAPNVRVVEPTRSEAIDALKSEIRQRVDSGELLSLEIESPAWRGGIATTRRSARSAMRPTG